MALSLVTLRLESDGTVTPKANLGIGSRLAAESAGGNAQEGRELVSQVRQERGDTTPDWNRTAAMGPGAIASLVERLLRLKEKETSISDEHPAFLGSETGLPASSRQFPVCQPCVLNRGSLGHPRLCARKACRFVRQAGGCRLGQDCPDCHQCAATQETPTRPVGKPVGADAGKPFGADAEPAYVLVESGEDFRPAVAGATELGEAPRLVDLSIGADVTGAMTNGCPSIGSIGHPFTCSAGCKYKVKARGCRDGPLCSRCHLCRWNRYEKKDEKV